MIESALAEPRAEFLGPDRGAVETGAFQQKTIDSKIKRLGIRQFRFQRPPEPSIELNPFASDKPYNIKELLEKYPDIPDRCRLLLRSSLKW